MLAKLLDVVHDERLGGADPAACSPDEAGVPVASRGRGDTGLRLADRIRAHDRAYLLVPWVRSGTISVPRQAPPSTAPRAAAHWSRWLPAAIGSPPRCSR
jgi:hypothetical protein